MMTWKHSQILRTIPFLTAFYLLALPAYAKYSGGSGTAQDPYQLGTCADLILLGSSPQDYDKCFVVVADIDLDPKLPARKVFDKAVIAPDTVPGNSSFDGIPFTGVFDGNGHTLSHLTIQGKDSLGLFGGLGGTAQIKDLGIVDVSVTGSGNYVGGLTGENGGYVSNCHSTGTVTVNAIGKAFVGGLVGANYIRVANCYSSVAVSAADSNSVGGLVGMNTGSIVDCNSTGVVSGKDRVGGLVGSGASIVNRCYSTGAVTGKGRVGGLVGLNEAGIAPGTVGNCYSTGAVTGEGPKSIAGGLAGSNDEHATLVNCYSTGKVAGTGTLGGLVGENKNCSHVANCFWDTQTSGQTISAGGTGRTTAQMKDKKTYCDTDSPKPDPNACWDFMGETKYGTSDIWQMSQGGGYPVLSVFNGYRPLQQLNGKGTVDDPYLISTAKDLGAVCYDPLACYKLTANIDLSGIQWSTAVIPDLWGTFDGNHLAIRNLKIPRGGGSAVGLFGLLEPLALVKDLGVENVTVASGGCYVGGLAGSNLGCGVVNCFSTGTVEGNTCSAFVGGLVGGSSALHMTDCYSSASVTCNADASCVGGLMGGTVGATLVINCYSNGKVTGKGTAGGLLGANSLGSVVNCYSTGEVTGGGADPNNPVGGLIGYNILGGSVVNCFSTGAVNGVDNVGGLLGSTDAGSVSNCYSAGKVTGSGQNVGGFVGFAFSVSDALNLGGGYLSITLPRLSPFSHCFWDFQASGTADGIGAIDPDLSGVTSKTTAQMMDKKTYCDTDSPTPDPNACWDFVDETKYGTSEIWQMPAGNGYPVLSRFVESGYRPVQQLKGKGTPDDPYLISTPAELGAVYYEPVWCYRLTKDIDLSGIQWSTAVIPYFCGVFDGDGHTISNLKVKGGGELGLFGKLINAMEQVKNLGVKNAKIDGSWLFVGGLAGRSNAEVNNCYSTGAISGQGAVGGLVGSNDGTQAISSQGAAGGPVENIGGKVSNCYSAAGVTGLVAVGGLIGDSTGCVTKCYSAGRVTGTLSVPPYLLMILPALKPGGLVGDNGSVLQFLGLRPKPLGTTTDCCEDSVWDNQTSQCSRSACGEGLSTNLMKRKKTYLDRHWDIVDKTARSPAHIWWIDDTKDYARLWWEP
jgi:hypothetical protein